MPCTLSLEHEKSRLPPCHALCPTNGRTGPLPNVTGRLCVLHAERHAKAGWEPRILLPVRMRALSGVVFESAAHHSCVQRIRKLLNSPTCSPSTSLGTRHSATHVSPSSQHRTAIAPTQFT
eukprot:361735-Chlamydomonas_euryale.AAC.6